MRQYHDYEQNDSRLIGGEIDGIYFVKRVKSGKSGRGGLYIKRGKKIYRNPYNKTIQDKI